MAAKGQPKTGGRKKGTPNKQTNSIKEKLAELNCDPAIVLAHFTNADWAKLNYPSEKYTEEKAGGVVNEVLYVTPELRVSAAKELMKYIYPQLKSIEHTGEPSEQFFNDFASAMKSAFSNDQ